MKNLQELLKDIIDNGVDKPDRTGIGSRAVNGRLLKWNLEDGFPIITTRKVSLRIAFEETMFFLRGNTDTKLLEEKNVNIWKGNTSREFLDKRGLFDLPEGDMGHGYGYVWRHFQGPQHKETDQIKTLLDGIKADPYGRRHVVSGWHPGELESTALPPCHMLHMYSVMEGKLNSSFVMRSNDVPYGLPYNIMGYALLNHIFSKFLGYKPGELSYMGWDVHIYQNQMQLVEEQLTREPKSLPTLKINKELLTLDDIMNLQWSDIELIGYDPHPDIVNKPPMAI